MAGPKEQAWVTSVVTEKDVEAALITCYSLRRMYTSRKVVVLASPKLSFNSRQALFCGFDFVFYLDKDFNLANLEAEEFAKLYSFLVLQSFDKCAYISPYMLAVKNCDDIFSEESSTTVMTTTDKNASVFLFSPSADHFNSIVNGLSDSTVKGLGIGSKFSDWVTNQVDKVLSLDKKYNILMQKGMPLVGYEDDVYMVNLKCYPEESDINGLKGAGTLEQLIADYWLQIRNNDVSPVINHFTQPEINHSFNLLQQKNEPIAIVGMSCRYPSSNNLEEFWNLLFDGEDGTGNPPPFRWLRDNYSKHGIGSKETNAGFLKTPIDEFDAKFFGISPKEAVFMDPQHRLMHELVWEALEDACINPTTLRGTSGSIFMGSWTNDYKDILNSAGIQDFYRKYMGNSIGAATARLSFLLGLTGPSVATESGCSAAMVAVHLACKSLQNGETNLALAGGVNLLLKPFGKDILPMVISPDGQCKTFSEDANGFARAEGCGVLVLKRFSDAVKNGDNIWALIRGSAIAQEGVSGSIGTPTVYCESLAMKMALNNAGVRPEQVSYVETHGTGTIVGDPLEVAAIAKAYNSPKRTKSLIIGSVKTNVGHTESCSGIAGIMKVVLCMKHEMIPAHRNFTKLNAAIDLEAVPAVLPMERLEWRKTLRDRRIAGVSSFGITGTDAHLILEEKPDIQLNNVLSMDKQVDRPFHLIKITAKTSEALMALLDSHKQSFEKIKEYSFADVAYSLNTGRADFNHRAVIIANSIDNAISCINKKMYLTDEVGLAKTDVKICFLFTGQGSQYPDMAKMLYTSSPLFQMHFDRSRNILQDCHNIDLRDVLWGEEMNSSENQINRTIYSQTAIFCVEYALLKLWESWGVKPDYVLGHSLGEFTAAVCAGILSLEDAITLIAERSKLIDQLPEGKMLVVQADTQLLQEKLKEFAKNDESKILDIAASNSESQTVVAGDGDVVTEFSKFCTGRKLKNTMLSSSHAFHSKHMDPTLNDYRNVAKGIKIGKTFDDCKYISGMRGDIVTPEDDIDAEYWVEHTREKVRFLEASKKAVELGCRIFVEIGPQPVLSALTMMNNDKNITCLPSLQKNRNEWETILNSVGKLYLKGVEIDWKGMDRFCSRKKVHNLPHYPFKGKKFWPEVTNYGGTMIHPLIGSSVSNASNIKIFQSGINIDQDYNYIKDHVIGNTVIFPGAGYLEICLAAGMASVENSSDSTPLGQPRRPMKVENLVIKAPLSLEDGKTCQIQTVVELNKQMYNEYDWKDLTVKIYHRQDESNSWLEHVVATFSHAPTAEELLVKFDTAKFLGTISQPGNTEIMPQFYNKLSSVGLNFGATFQSLEKIWMGNNEKTLLAKVKVPENDNKQFGNYIVHPVVLDAMIQAIMVLKIQTNADSKTKLYVPIKIGKYLWLSSSKSMTSDLYIYVLEESTALLIDSNGNVLGTMTNVELIDTTVKTIESVLEQQTTTMPQLWEEIWHPEQGPAQYRHHLKICKNENFFSDLFVNDFTTKFKNFNETQAKLFGSLERLVYLNFVRCLYTCGWVPTLNTHLNKTTLMDQLEIKADNSKLLNYIFHVLSEEGIFQKVEKDVWKVIALPPSLDEIQVQLSPANLRDDIVEDFNATQLFLKVGENYADLLQGKKSALSFLFSGTEGNPQTKWPSVADFETEYDSIFRVNENYSEVIRYHLTSCKRHMNGRKDILRILEVGAGAGSLTLEYMKMLKQSDIQFEYTFTDISSALFPTVEKKLEAYLKQVTFKKLNIEEDPISQGFMPNYYDYVIASDVIHATRNINDTLGNIRMLLRTNGLFIMKEQTRKNRLITYLFGLLDGFWCFEDTDTRLDHCTLSNEKWKDILNGSGFKILESFPTLYNYHSLMYALKTEEKIPMHVSKSKSTKYWLLFHQEDNPSSQYLLKQLSALKNRQVIVITRGENFKMTDSKSEWKFSVRGEVEQDFSNLMESLECRCDSNNLEGILYAWSLDTSSSTQNYVLQPYFYMIKSLLSRQMSINAKIICLVSGIMPIEGNNFLNCHQSTIIGFNKSLKNERPDVLCRCVDIGPSQDLEENFEEQLFFELWNTCNRTHVAYDRNNTRYTSRLHSLKNSTHSALKLPNSYLHTR